MNIKRESLILTVSILIFIAITFLVEKNIFFIINLDNSVYNWITNHPSPTISNFMLSITNVGDVLGTIIIILVFGLFLILKNKKDFYIFTLATISGILSTEIIKHLTQRVRPYNLLEQGFGFPSAHAMISTIFLLSSIFLIKPLIKNEFLARLFLIIVSIVFPLVAFSRIYLSVHFTSDVIAGVVLGLVCFLLAEICCHKKENVL